MKTSQRENSRREKTEERTHEERPPHVPQKEGCGRIRRKQRGVARLIGVAHYSLPSPLGEGLGVRLLGVRLFG